MSQAINYNFLPKEAPKSDDSKSPKRAHYIWKICTWLTCCCATSSAVAAEESTDPKQLLERALKSASRQLRMTVQIVESSPLQGRDYLLEVLSSEHDERIDIISPHKADESLKSLRELTAEIYRKVVHHFAFKERAKTNSDQYLITKDGCKIELNGFLTVASGPDGEKFLKYGDRIIQFNGKDFDFNRVHSYTTITTSLIGRIRMFDDYDEIRIDSKRGFFINIDRTLPDFMTIVRQ